MTDTRDEVMLEHLHHMAEVRPAGLDRDAAKWAFDELVSLSGKAIAKRIARDTLADTIATLSRQLAEAQTISKQRLSALEFVRSERDKLHHKLAEAQVVIERQKDALEYYVCDAYGQCREPKLKDGSCIHAEVGRCGKIAEDALLHAAAMGTTDGER